MRVYPEHEDLGLWPEGDQTEDLVSATRNAPGRCANTAEGRNTHRYITSRNEVQP
ncbi:hypothetical protein MMIN_14360 [Mycolicibacter minnesotensis]|nr:hypothetical protein MMIN_14360 [Mycolicibacter minnesotensis]